jgi:hypothetical protein
MADAVNIWPPGFRLPGPNGIPVAAGYAEFYSAGTSDPLTVYADSALTVSLGDTVYTDSAGYFVTAFAGSTKTLVYTGTGLFKTVIFDGLGGSVTHDNMPGAVVAGVGGGGASGITQDQADVRYVRNPNALTAAGSIVDVDILGFWDIAGAANKGLTFSSLKTKLTTDFQADGRMFPVGTRLAYQQTTPPAGWTKETGAAYNDATLRFTTGSVGTSGTASFNTTFASRTFTGTVSSDTPSLAKTASHNHTVTSDGRRYGSQSGSVGFFTSAGDSAVAGTDTQPTSFAGSSTAHAHGLVMNAADFAVKYVEMCIGIKA